MSHFLDSICTIITVFHKHAEDNGGCSKLSRRKVKEFIQTEFADVIAKPRDPQTIEKILWFLEWDGDGEIEFNEFLILVCRVAKACYWYLPRGSGFLQKTTSGKTLPEPELDTRGNHQRRQEVEQQTHKRNHRPQQETEVQRDTRVKELETPEERGSHQQQRNRQRRNDATRSTEPGENISQEYEERSQEPHDRQRRRQTPAAERRDVQLRECRSLRENEPELQANERRNQEELQREQRGEVRSRSQTREPQPQPNRWSSRQLREAAGPAQDQRNQQPQGADRGRNNEPHQGGLVREERNRNQLRELEQKEVGYSSREPREPESLGCRCPQQPYRREPLQRDLRYQDTCESEREVDEEERKKEEELDYPEGVREIRRVQDGEERDGRRKKEPVRERIISHQRELDLDIIERFSDQTRERRVDETREREPDGRRCETVRYERTREAEVAVAEADVEIRRVSRDMEPREDKDRRDRRRERGEPEDKRRIFRGREREEPVQDRSSSRQQEQDLQVTESQRPQRRGRDEQEATNDQRDIGERRGREILEPQDNGRRRETGRYERTREAEVAVAEADVKIGRVSREVEPYEVLNRRDCCWDRGEAEDERRISQGREREEPVRDRTISHQRELDLDVIERFSDQTRERRVDETREREADGRRRETGRYERTREAEVAVAETDVKIQRVSRDVEPRDNMERRDCCRDRKEPEDERRISQGREREEPVRDRTISHQRELDLDVIERFSDQTRERRVDETREREPDGRRRETVRYERSREAEVAVAEADVNIRRVSRDVEPREAMDRRDRRRERGEAEDKRRICKGREREEPVQDRSSSRQREQDLQVIESHRPQRRGRDKQEAITDQRDIRERRGHEILEPQDNGRRCEPVRYERTREAEVAVAEADVKIGRVSREVEPYEVLNRRDCCWDRGEAEDERRISQGREREEPVRDRTISHQRELDLDVIERFSDQTRERRVDETREREADGRRREALRYEGIQEAEVAVAEADVNIRRVSRDVEPRDDLERRDRCRERGEAEDERRIFRGREREEPVRDRTIGHQRELDLDIIERFSNQTRERRVDETREREPDGRRRETLRYERNREAEVAVAEADVKIRRVSRDMEPREDMDRRDCRRERGEAEDKRRICKGREREEPVQDRSSSRQREQDLQVIESHRPQRRGRDEQEATTDQRDIQERYEREILEPQDNGRRREPVRYERTREAAAVVVAEADVKIGRVSREVEPYEVLKRRDCCWDRGEAEDERRIFRGREREEPVRDRTISHQRELDLDVIERFSDQTRERRVDETREREPDGRRRETVRYERSREAEVAVAEADVEIRRVSQDVEPREDMERRDRRRERGEAEDERRIFRGREREEPVQDRTSSRRREQDLQVIESHRPQRRGRDEQEATNDQRDIGERYEREILESQDNGRRREPVRYERTREATAVTVAEADVEIRRVSRDVEPREDMDRRDRRRERGEAENERRIFRGREREEPVQDRSSSRQREQDLQVLEGHRRQTRDMEEQEATTDQRDIRERYEREILEPQDNGRRREPVRYERTREAEVAVAEADVKIRSVSRDEERERSNLQILEEDEQRGTRFRKQVNEAPREPRESIPRGPLEAQEGRKRRILPEEETCDPNTCRVLSGEGSRPERSLYRTVEVDDKDLSPAGEEASVSDVRVSYVPAEPDVRPEVQVLPSLCKAENVAYLIHVIQNLKDPEATTYEIVCHQPNEQGPPLYVKKCYVSPQPLVVPGDGSDDPEPHPQRDERGEGDTKARQEGNTSASSFGEKTKQLDELERSETKVKDGAQQVSASELDGVKGDPRMKEDGRDVQCSKRPDLEEEDQPQGDGAKASRERVPQEPESSRPEREREDRERKSCPTLPQEAAEKTRPQLPRRDEANHGAEEEDGAAVEKGQQVENIKRRSQRVDDSQPQQEENTKRRSQQVSDSQPQQEENTKRRSQQVRDPQPQQEEEESCRHTKQGPPAPQPSPEAEAKAS